MIGRVKNIVKEKGYCFIRVRGGQGSSVDYFCHRSALRGITIDEIEEGDAMEFEPIKAEKGPRAEDVRRIQLDAAEVETVDA